MAYDINTMPRTAAEFEELVEASFNAGHARYSAEKATAEADARTRHAQLPEGDGKPPLDQFIASAVSAVEPPRTRAEWEATYKAAGYYPQPAPEPEPEPDLDCLKRQKLSELKRAFERACESATVATADGWEADANEAANRNVQGLITSLEARGLERAVFCGADNSFHEIALDGLKALQLQIIAKGQDLYGAKWELRAAIEGAQTKEELAAIQIAF